MKNKHELAGVIAVAMSALSFASLGYFGRILTQQGLSTAASLTFRFTFAAAVLGIVLALKRSWRLDLKSLTTCLLLGAFGYTVQSGLFFISLQRLPTGIASLLLFMNPTLVAAITLAHEKRRPYIKESVAILLSILGCYFVLDISASFKFDIIGILSGLGAAIWYAFYIKISEKVLHKIEPIQATTYISLGAGLTFLLIAAFNNEITLPTSTQAWTAIIGISVLSTVIPITLFFKGINILGAHRASIISTLEPVFTSMLGALLLQETFSTIQFIGAVAIIAAVVVIQYPTRPHRNQTAQKNHLQEGIL